jgi:hypothetical protein
VSIAGRIIPLVLVAAALGCAPMDVSTDFNSTTTSSVEGGGTQFGATINGIMWYWNVSWNDVKDTPDWSPGEEPAISMPKAIQLALGEINKYDQSPNTYALDKVEWLSIDNGCCDPNHQARKWVYIVNFERIERFENGSRGTILIPVLLDGRIIEGKKESPRGR